MTKPCKMCLDSNGYLIPGELRAFQAAAATVAVAQAAAAQAVAAAAVAARVRLQTAKEGINVRRREKGGIGETLRKG